MGWPVVLGLLALSSPLEDGKALYRAGQLAPALDRLLEGLDHPADRREEAELRLYVGLIQWSYQRGQDARVSFAKAVELDPRLEAPPGAPAPVVKLLKELRAEQARKSAGPGPRREARPPPPPPPKGPATLQPYEAGPRPLELNPRPQAGPEPEAPALTTRPPPEASLSTSGVVLLSAGGAAFVGGVVLSILAAVDGQAAHEQEDKAAARERYDRAGTESRLGVAAFVLSGALVGVAAVTLSF